MWQDTQGSLEWAIGVLRYEFPQSLLWLCEAWDSPSPGASHFPCHSAPGAVSECAQRGDMPHLGYSTKGK